MPKKGENIYKRKDGRWEGRYMSRQNHSPKPPKALQNTGCRRFYLQVEYFTKE